MIRALAPLGIGVLAYALGMLLIYLLMLILFQGVGTTPGSIRGGTLTFKVAWSVAAFLVTPAGATAVAVALRRVVQLRGQSFLWSIAVALFLYGLTLGLLARPISVANDCQVGVAWPISVPGCD